MAADAGTAALGEVSLEDPQPEESDRPPPISAEIIHQPRNPVSGGSAGPVVAVVEASSGIDWKHHFISVWILLFSAGTAVADQQLNKQSNSSIFNAPFFFLYYNQLLRVGTFAGYFLARVLHENFFKKMLKREDKWRRHESQVGLTRDADTDSSPSGPGAILREALLIFGPKGLTLRSVIVYLVPFALFVVLTNGLYYLAVTYASVSECATIGSSFIVIVYIISCIFLKEKLLIFKSVGITVCIAGIFLTAFAAGTELATSSDSWIAAGLVIASSVSLAVMSVAFKKYLGTPTLGQICLFHSLSSMVNVILTWPLFLALKLTNLETWDFATAPWGLMTGQAIASAVGNLIYYAGISFASPVFISLTRPLQILMNIGIDSGARGVPFGTVHFIGTALVIVGFLMLVLPNKIVDLPFKRLLLEYTGAQKNSQGKSNPAFDQQELPVVKV